VAAWYPTSNYHLARLVLAPLKTRGTATAVLRIPAETFLEQSMIAGATQIEKHERERKRKRCLSGHRRGTDPAALDAAGAGMGSIGHAVFGFVVWRFAPSFGFASLGVASIAWLLVSMSLWRMRRSLRLSQ
jgi:hypothetical protein